MNLFKKKIIFFLLFFLFISLGLNFSLYKKFKKIENPTKIIAILDGDTVILENKTRLRLREIDAPEIEYCGGKEAKTTLEKLLLTRQVVLKETMPDQKGRLMAYLFSSGKNINFLMMTSGLVRYHHDKTIYSDLMKNAWEKAKENRLGIYGLCWEKENKKNPKCFIKGNIDEKGRRVYYLPNCAQYQFVIVEKDFGEEWFCNEKEANEKGYQKAKTCSKI